MAERPSVNQVWEHVAFAVAARSLCDRAKVGAVIVDTKGRVIATGYNGPPAGFDHFDQTCTAWCPRAGSRKVPKLKLVRTLKDMVSEAKTTQEPADTMAWLSVDDSHNPAGCSAPPIEEVRLGVEGIIPLDADEMTGWLPPEELQKSSDYSDCPALHAEANALMASERVQREGGTLYVTTDVCYSCAKLIANSGVAAVYVADDGGDTSHRNPSKSYELLRDCGIAVILDGS